MKIFLIVSLLFTFFTPDIFGQDWNAEWISVPELENDSNTWLAFRKSFDLDQIPSKAITKIGADSKYWLWINGELVIFEGGLKRGPNPQDTYYDELDIAPWLQEGENIVSIKLLYFGKEGFAHNSSGKAGLIFFSQAPGFCLKSDRTWDSAKLQAYKTTEEPSPNYRLAESNILFDAREDLEDWQSNLSVKMKNSTELGPAGSPPWNNLVLRPIPFFKNSGLREYQAQEVRSSNEFDTIVCQLPYNAQITPYFEIDAPKAGQRITIFTDNYLHYNGGADYIRAEYITREGVQDYESLGWINGHKVYYVVPKGVKLLSLNYRETGYNTEFSGSFECSDPFFNTLWEKARRTLYLTMRDNYMDCPDRERAQWTGDAVHQSGQAFYALSPSSHSLSKKWLLEIVDWQREDGVLYAPVPSGNWNKELPGQLLATIGYYGLWNYYLHSGDKKTLSHVYKSAKNYLKLWERESNGLVKFRGGDWTWGDWGEEKDIELIYSAFYYLALKGMKNSAMELDYTEDVTYYSQSMIKFDEAFNSQYWTGKAYRDLAYEGQTDDRVQALAVVSGLAKADKYPQLLKVFKEERNASPYMEKFVMEALFQMGEVDFALERHKERFRRMVNNTEFSTLWEGWNYNDPTYGGGTVNHSWSGGALTILSQFLSGISPLEAGYKTFQILPQPGKMEKASATVSSVAGTIKSTFENSSDQFILNTEIPANTTAIIGIPSGFTKIIVNDALVWENGRYYNETMAFIDEDDSYVKFKMKNGNWKFKAVEKRE
jgi:hypothetical protein